MEEKEVVESTTQEEVKSTNALANINMTNVSVDLFGNNNAKKITSLDLNNEENTDMLLNASQEPDYRLNEEIGKEIQVIGCYLIERENEDVNPDTGELMTFKNHTTFLFDVEGKSHVTGSNSCYQSFTQIVALKGMPTKENPITLIPIKTPAKEKGHEYLRLKIKTNK